MNELTFLAYFEKIQLTHVFSVLTIWLCLWQFRQQQSFFNVSKMEIYVLDEIYILKDSQNKIYWWFVCVFLYRINVLIVLLFLNVMDTTKLLTNIFERVDGLVMLDNGLRYLLVFIL